jgi:hypothetical protein
VHARGLERVARALAEHGGAHCSAPCSVGSVGSGQRRP